MPRILRELPFGPNPVAPPLAVPGDRSIPYRRDRIVLWVSVTGSDAERLPPGTPRFPSVLDTGFNDAFLISAVQLVQWGPPGVLTAVFRNGSALSFGGVRLDLFDAAVWVHPNKPGSTELDPGAEPYCLELPNGIAVAPPGTPAERELPLIGLLAVRFSELRVEIDGISERVTVTAPDRT
jgi:hypothetical protein